MRIVLKTLQIVLYKHANGRLEEGHIKNANGLIDEIEELLSDIKLMETT